MNPRTLAAAARRAAQKIERSQQKFGRHDFSCFELKGQVREHCRGRYAEDASNRYAKFMQKHHNFVWFGSVANPYRPQEVVCNADCRVLALCFFAAAVETGDA